MKRTILAIIVLSIISNGLNAQELTGKQQETADQLISQVARGSSLSVLKSAIKLGQRANPQQLGAINDYLSKVDIPPLTELAADARYALVLQGHAKSLPKPTEQETLFSISVFEQRANDALTHIQEHELMQKTLPILESLESYQDLFWDVHVLENQMRNAYKTAVSYTHLTLPTICSV